MNNIFETDLGKQEANYQALSPLTLFHRVISAHPQQTAVVHGKIRRSWGELGYRCKQLAYALKASGVGEGSAVAVFAANTPEMLETHFAIPLTGGVICAINFRLDAKTVAFILEHSEASVLFADRAFAKTVNEAVSILDKSDLLVIEINDVEFTGEGKIAELDYEDYLRSGDTKVELEQQPSNE